MEYPNDFLTFLIGILTVIGAAAGFIKWKIVQIKKDTTRNVSTSSNVQENLKEINQLKSDMVALETKVSEIRDRVSRMEGQFDQHNREGKD